MTGHSGVTLTAEQVGDVCHALHVWAGRLTTDAQNCTDDPALAAAARHRATDMQRIAGALLALRLNNPDTTRYRLAPDEETS